MSDRLDVTCPCCRTKLVVDPGTGDVLSEERPKGPTTSFEEALGDVRAGAAKREEAFDKAFDQTRRLESVLEKKFEEARKKAAKEKGRPKSPFDLD